MSDFYFFYAGLNVGLILWAAWCVVEKRHRGKTAQAIAQNPAPHVHDNKITGVKTFTSERFVIPEGTIVLMNCSCGLHSTTIIPGHWLLADLVRKESEIAELERWAK